MMNALSEEKFKITKTCPFLGKLCIAEECPSFLVLTGGGVDDIIDYVKLRTLKRRGTWWRDAEYDYNGYALRQGRYLGKTPCCSVLSGHQPHSLCYQDLVPVGDTLKWYVKIRPREWCGVSYTNSSMRVVDALPEIKEDERDV